MGIESILETMKTIQVVSNKKKMKETYKMLCRTSELNQTFANRFRDLDDGCRDGIVSRARRRIAEKMHQQMPKL